MTKKKMVEFTTVTDYQQTFEICLICDVDEEKVLDKSLIFSTPELSILTFTETKSFSIFFAFFSIAEDSSNKSNFGNFSN